MRALRPAVVRSENDNGIVQLSFIVESFYDIPHEVVHCQQTFPTIAKLLCLAPNVQRRQTLDPARLVRNVRLVEIRLLRQWQVCKGALMARRGYGAVGVMRVMRRGRCDQKKEGLYAMS